ncbi:unnamed protein product [Tenebrio molitor]|jgi:cathepsin B|nr:unnamed protein product [Tenebrio molitor]
MKILPIIILFIQLRLAAFQWKRFDGDPTTRRTTKKTRYKFKDSLDIVKYYGSTNPLNGLRSNFPLNMTAEYLESLVGHEDLLRTHDELEVLHHKPESLSKLPKDFDARKEWPICEPIIGHVREQGQCDAAWAVVPASVMSDTLCIESNGKELVHLSAEDIITCCSECRETNGCEGGLMYKVWDFWMETGIVTGGEYSSEQGCKPYTESSFKSHTATSCESSCSTENYQKTYSEDKNKGALAYRLPREEKQIRAELKSHGPVTAVMAVYIDFLNYQDGVYTHETGEEIGTHVVKIIGWGEEKKKKYWLAANSWGNQWGNMGGFFKIERGTDHCGIESDVRSGRISKKLSPREFLEKYDPAKGSSESRRLILSFAWMLILWLTTVTLLF